MKLLFTAPVYISTKTHLGFIQETLESINTKHKHTIYLVENYIAEEHEGDFKALVKKHKAIVKKNPDGNNVAAGWNQGIKYGIDEGFDYFFVINLDIIFKDTAIDNLIDFAQEKPEALIWTCSEWPDRRTFFDVEIERVSYDKLKLTDGSKEHDWDRYDEHPHFSCFMINKRTIDMLKRHEKDLAEPEPGYFDSHFKRAYFEDQDYHQRVLMAGFTAYKCNEALFYHYGSRTIKADKQLEEENVHSYESNRKYFKDKWGYDSHGKVPSNLERVKLSHLYPFNKSPDS